MYHLLPLTNSHPLHLKTINHLHSSNNPKHLINPHHNSLMNQFLPQIKGINPLPLSHNNQLHPHPTNLPKLLAPKTTHTKAINSPHQTPNSLLAHKHSKGHTRPRKLD